MKSKNGFLTLQQLRERDPVIVNPWRGVSEMNQPPADPLTPDLDTSYSVALDGLKAENAAAKKIIALLESLDGNPDAPTEYWESWRTVCLEMMRDGYPSQPLKQKIATLHAENAALKASGQALNLAHRPNSIEIHNAEQELRVAVDALSERQVDGLIGAFATDGQSYMLVRTFHPTYYGAIRLWKEQMAVFRPTLSEAIEWRERPEIDYGKIGQRRLWKIYCRFVICQQRGIAPPP
jgi:hypothetical protein